MRRFLGAVLVVLAALSGGAWIHGSNSYLGQVATRSFVPNSTIASSSATWTMARSMHWARDTIVNPQIVFANYYITTSNTEAVLAGAGTIKVTVEFPSGTFTQCGGTVTFALGNNTVSCPGITIPNGSQFWIRDLQVNTNGVVFGGGSGNTNSTDPSEGFEFGTGTPSDLTSSGTVSPGFDNSFGYWPVAILAQTLRPSILLGGDSRTTGIYDVVTNASADLGEVARSIGPTFGYSEIAIAGTSLSAFLSAGKTYRNQLVPYFTHFYDGWAINDLAAGNSAATVAANRTTFANLYSTKKIIGGDCVPYTNSSDSWETLSGQTTNTVTATFNGLVRAGISGESFYWDISNGIDPTQSGKWPVNGTAFFNTPDGLHENSTSNVTIQNSGVVNLALIHYP